MKKFKKLTTLAFSTLFLSASLYSLGFAAEQHFAGTGGLSSATSWGKDENVKAQSTSGMMGSGNAGKMVVQMHGLLDAQSGKGTNKDAFMLDRLAGPAANGDLADLTGLMDNFSHKSHTPAFDAIIGLDATHYIDDTNSVGAAVQITTRVPSSRVSTSVNEYRMKNGYVHYDSPNMGSIHMGSVIGAESQFRVGAESLAVGSGGITGDWDRYFNIGGWVNIDTSTSPNTIASYGITTAGAIAANNSGAANFTSNEGSANYPFMPKPGLHSERLKPLRDAITAAAMGTSFAENLVSGEGLKMSYYTPVLGDAVKVGVSFTPRQNDVLANGMKMPAVNTGSMQAIDSYKNIFGAGVMYSSPMGDDAMLRASVTGEFGSSSFEDESRGPSTTEPQLDKLKSWQAGAHFCASGFEVAGSYGNLGKSGMFKEDANDEHESTTYYTVGAGYNAGDFGVSATYFKSKKDKSELTNLVIGTQYDVSPLASVYMEYAKVSTEEYATTFAGGKRQYLKLGDDANNTGSVVLGGMKIKF